MTTIVTPSYTISPIPLEKLCSLEVRELLEQGTPKGSGHNQSAIKVLKDLIGVENFCIANGIPYEGTARQYYESFLLASGIDSDSTTESRWKSAIAANPSPSLSPDKIQNCLNAWNRQHGQTGGQRVNLPRPTAPKPKQVAKLPPIEGPVKLARFDVIPTDAPQATKPVTLPNGVPQGATVKTYRYSQTQFVKRFDWEDKTKPKGRDKTFRQCHVNDEGDLTWGKGNDPWPAYRESEAIAANGWVFILEGEECVETFRRLGLVAITFQGSNWTDEAIAPALTRLKDAGNCYGFIVIPDNDKTGEDKKQKVLSVAAKIESPALDLSMPNLHPECPEKGDVADWEKWGQSMGMTRDDFIKRLEAEIHAAVNRRSQQSQESETVADKPVEGLNADDLRIKVLAFTQEKDQAKREVMLYELRKLGVGEKGVNRIAAQLSQNGTTPRATRLSASEFRSRISGGKKWLVPGLIPQVGVTLITGPSGGGKSTFAFDLAGSVICGDRFMGEAIKENGPVVFACSDEPTDESQERALLQGFFHSDDFEFLEQWNLSQMEMLEEAIEDRRPKLVVVDSFDSIHREAGFDENATMASETIKQFNSLSQKYSCAFIVLHHENKDPKLSGVNKARGSTAIVASANAHLRIIGKDDNPEVKYVKIEKMRGGATKTILCNVDYHNVRFEPEVNLEYEQDKDDRTALVSFLRSNLNRWFEVQELNHYLGWSGKGIYRLLKQLTDRGEVSRKPNSMGRKGMVYGIFCTDGENHQNDLTPPSLVKSVSPEKKISETTNMQGLEVSHNLVTSQSHLVTSQSHTVTSETAETLSLTDSHTIDQKEGYPEGGGLTVDSVPMETVTETAPIPVNNSTAINDQETTGAIAVETRFKTGDWVVCRGDETVKMQIVSIVDNDMATVSFPDDPEVSGLVMALSDLSPYTRAIAIESSQSVTQWEEFRGQEVSEGDLLWHKSRGRLTVTLATRTGTLKVKADNGASCDLTYSKANVTHVYRKNR